MIRLFTGLPGSGKSLSAVAEVMRYRAEGRTVYAHGIDGLAVGLAEPLDDPLKWQDLPDGSVVVIDEAQKVFPARKMQDPIPPVTALSEHRHRGFDFVLVTQNPMMLDSYVRRLVGEHVHCVRRFGLKGCTRYTWGECIDDPQSSAMRSRAIESMWRYPRELFGKYQSASLHTVKPKVPARLLLIPAALVFACAALWVAWNTVAGFQDTERTVDVEPKGIAATAQVAQQERSIITPKSQQPKTDAEYFAAMTPRIPGVIASAPIFDNRQPMAKPELYCAMSYRPQGTICRCLTEQGTLARVEYKVCSLAATTGIYNPYREPPRQTSSSLTTPASTERKQSGPEGQPASDSKVSVPHGMN